MMVSFVRHMSERAKQPSIGTVPEFVIDVFLEFGDRSASGTGWRIRPSKNSTREP